MSQETLILTNERIQALDTAFVNAFGAQPERYFSAPGRTEISGNHTDHQRGRVLAAAVNLDMQAAVRCNGTQTIRILSQGYPLCEVDLNQLTPQEAEINTTPALIRGVAAKFVQLGCQVQGFDAYMESTVLPGLPGKRLGRRRGLGRTAFHHCPLCRKCGNYRFGYNQRFC